ncbi:MAG: hypothetical protein GC184_13025 [Rhizobiales bacterium]|nr:hypothetical protein [Hyphomicrobiales bacterium]
MTKIVFAALLICACYSVYRAMATAAEKQREIFARARASQKSVEPRDLGTLREQNGIYVPEDRWDAR